MKIPVTRELKDIFVQILDAERTESEWAEIESDDMFQSHRYRGGFDATEMAFCFSFYDDDGSEYWFQLTLDELQAIKFESISEVDARPAGNV